MVTAIGHDDCLETYPEAQRKIVVEPLGGGGLAHRSSHALLGEQPWHSDKIFEQSATKCSQGKPAAANLLVGRGHSVLDYKSYAAKDCGDAPCVSLQPGVRHPVATNRWRQWRVNRPPLVPLLLERLNSPLGFPHPPPAGSQIRKDSRISSN